MTITIEKDRKGQLRNSRTCINGLSNKAAGKVMVSAK
jgi:hypothetical protein